MRRIILLLLAFLAPVFSATVTVTVNQIGQKIPRNTQVAAQEDTWTINGSAGSTPMYLVIRPSQDTLYHSTSGQTASDGFTIPGGSYFYSPIGSGPITFYLRPSSTAGVVDCVVVPAPGMGSTGAKALVTDAASALTQGNSQKATYTINTLTSAPITGNYPVLTFEAGTTKTCRVRRVVISNPGFATAGTVLTFELVRTSAASSAGTTVTPAPHDTTDSAFSGVARKDGATITAGTQIVTFAVAVPATVAGAFTPFVFEFYGQMSKSLTVPAGITNGMALRCINGAAGASSLCASMEITEE